MLAVLVVASALAGRPKPVPPLTVDFDAALACPDRHAATAWQRLDSKRLDAEEYARRRAAFDREVARWVVCARVMGVKSYGLPPVEDPLSQLAVSAALTEPGRRERMEAIEAMAPELPDLAALLALEELEVLEVVDRAEPQARLALTAAALGGWGCPQARAWGPGPDGIELAWCTDGRGVPLMAQAGMARLVALAQPTLEMHDWLGVATQKRRSAIWAEIQETWFPLPEPLPLAVPERGVGIPLDPDLGWSGQVARDLVIWTPRPRFHMTPVGLILPPPYLETRAPSSWDGAPVVYVEPDVTAGELDAVFRDNGVFRPRLVAEREDGVGVDDLVEMRLLWSPSARPPADALVIDIGPIGGRVSALRERAAASDAPGPTWLRVHPDTLYGDIVVAQGAVASARPGPVRFVVARAEPAGEAADSGTH